MRQINHFFPHVALCHEVHHDRLKLDQPTFKLDLPILAKRTQDCPHRHAQSVSPQMSLDPIIWQLKRTITQWGKEQPGNGSHTIGTVHSSTFYQKERNHQEARSPALVCIVKLGCQLLWICNQLRYIALEDLCGIFQKG